MLVDALRTATLGSSGCSTAILQLAVLLKARRLVLLLRHPPTNLRRPLQATAKVGGRRNTIRLSPHATHTVMVVVAGWLAFANQPPNRPGGTRHHHKRHREMASTPTTCQHVATLLTCRNKNARLPASILLVLQEERGRGLNP